MAIELVQERLELVRKNQAPMYKVIILDLSMPVIDGPMTAVSVNKLLNASPSVKAPLICCYSAFTEEPKFKRRALAAGI